jgi:aryl-alcohol dehydrogenase-like predicted oxidoreductase
MIRLALGTVQFGLPYGIANHAGQVTRPIARDMLSLATSKGVDTLDTAIAYGESESCLGEIGTQGFKLVTKLPAVPDGHSDIKGWVREQVAASFSRLGGNSVYGLLLHRPDQLLKADGAVLFNALSELKDAGLVQKIGVSIYAPDELDALVPRYRFDLVQAPFNLIDRRIFTSGWLQRLKQDGVEIHTRSAFLQGLLLMPQSAIPAKFAPWAELWAKWQSWLAQYSVTAVQACLAYPLTFPEIERVVIGADSTAQLEQIISASQEETPLNLPDLSCDDENLINPANWSRL